MYVYSSLAIVLGQDSRLYVHKPLLEDDDANIIRTDIYGYMYVLERVALKQRELWSCFRL
jgi:hypothetical protein